MRIFPLAAAVAAFSLVGTGPAADGEPRPDDPKGWLLAQLDRFDPRPAMIAAVPPRTEVAQQLADYLEETRAARGLRQAAMPRAPAAPAAMSAAMPAAMPAMAA